MNTGLVSISKIRIVHQVRMIIAASLVAHGIAHHQVARGTRILVLPQDTYAGDCLSGQVCVITIATRLVLIGVEADVRTGAHHEAVRRGDKVVADHRGLVQQPDTGVRTIIGVLDIDRPYVVRILQQVKIRDTLPPR